MTFAYQLTKARPALRTALLGSALAGAAAFAPAALAQTAPPSTGTLAGTVITNIARASYDAPGGGDRPVVESAPATITVSELLVVDVVSTDGTDVPTTPGATDTVLTFTVTNTGNGVETYDLTTVVPPSPTSTVTGLFIDADGDGVIDPTEQAYDPATGIELDPGETVQILVRVTTSPTAGDGATQDVGLVAESQTLTGSEPAGTVIAGAGDNGSDAVVGVGGARDRDDGTVIVQAAVLALEKTASVSGPAIPGATITYTITARATGSGTVRGVIVTDVVPTDTSYTAASIKLNGSGVTDADDSDRGEIVANEVRVDVGDLAGGSTATVTFDVTID